MEVLLELQCFSLSNFVLVLHSNLGGRSHVRCNHGGAAYYFTNSDAGPYEVVLEIS